MKLLIPLILLSLNAFSVTDTQIMAGPNRAYMNFFLKSYIPWHRKTFNSNFYGIELKDGKKFLKQALYELDHWKTKEYPRLDQILIGQSFSGKKPLYHYQIYLTSGMRQSQFIQKLKLPAPPLFVSWNDQKEVCFLLPEKNTSIIKSPYPDNTTLILLHYCQTAKGFEAKKMSIVTHTPADWPNPFIHEDIEIRTYINGNLNEVFYPEKYTHIGKIPLKHYHYINTHGQKTFLPFDKYSTDKEGNLTIYYP